MTSQDSVDKRRMILQESLDKSIKNSGDRKGLKESIEREVKKIDESWALSLQLQERIQEMVNRQLLKYKSILDGKGIKPPRKRLLVIEDINSCIVCAHCKFRGDSNDSFYGSMYCDHVFPSRIICRTEETEDRERNGEVPIPFPDWCPLSDVEEG